MPSNLALCALVFLLGGCWFDADYRAGGYRCGDGRCPAPLVCSASQVCVAGDARGTNDAARDAPIDGRTAALTCVDPGVLPGSGGTAMGTTTASSKIAASCGGFVMNGGDAVYRITASAGAHLLVSVTGLDGYVIAPCTPSPATPVCLGNAFATPGNPISVTAIATGDYFVVVDHTIPAMTGSYTLDVTVN